MPAPSNTSEFPESGTLLGMVMEPNAPIEVRPVLVIAMVKSAGVGSSPPGPSSTIPAAVTNSPDAFAPPNAIGLEAEKVKTGPDPPDQMRDVVTPFISGVVNVIGVPTPIEGEKSPNALAPKANPTATWVARVGFGLSRVATPPKATPPVIV